MRPREDFYEPLARLQPASPPVKEAVRELKDILHEKTQRFLDAPGIAFHFADDEQIAMDRVLPDLRS